MQCEQQDSRESDTDFIRFGFFDADDIYGRGNFCFNTTSCFPFTSNGTFASTTIDAFTDTFFTVKTYSIEQTSTTEISSASADCDELSENSDSSNNGV